jgi:hypothetical protein
VPAAAALLRASLGHAPPDASPPLPRLAAPPQLLEAAMADAARVTAPECRVEVAALLRAARAAEADGVFNVKHRAALEVFCLRGLTANALCTDDSYAFNRTAAEVKAAIAALPGAQAQRHGAERKGRAWRCGALTRIARAQSTRRRRRRALLRRRSRPRRCRRAQTPKRLLLLLRSRRAWPPRSAPRPRRRLRCWTRAATRC